MMTWSDRDEALYQLRRRRQRVLRQLMVVTLAHAIGAIVLETFARQHRALHILTVLAVAVSAAGFGSVAVLGARWGLTSNATESWSATRRRDTGKTLYARRAQAIRDGTWPPRQR